MKVKIQILNQINTPAIRTEIAVKLKTGEQNVYKAIKLNEDNGRMTKMDFLIAVSEVLKVPVTAILETQAKRRKEKANVVQGNA